MREQRKALFDDQMRKWKAAGETGSKPRQPKELRTLSAETIDTLPSIPDSWAWDCLGWMTLAVEYGSSAKSAEIGSHVVLRMGNLQNGKIEWNDLAFSSNAEEIQDYLLRPGDVLFNRTNSPELVGKTAIYRGERPALFAGYLIRINHAEELVLSGYLNWFLNSPVAKQYGNTVKTDGVNQSNINGDKLTNYPFPYCSSAEQREICKILDQNISLTDHSIEDIDTNLAKAEALRQSILRKAFSGELVRQERDDQAVSGRA